MSLKPVAIVCNDEEWNDYYNDLLQKDNTLEYLYGEYMECDTANIQDVIIDFMYFKKLGV